MWVLVDITTFFLLRKLSNKITNQSILVLIYIQGEIEMPYNMYYGGQKILAVTFLTFK
jgi:hypothetical protein